MKKSSIQDHLFAKLFFPKVVLIESPGIIISQTAKKYGNKQSKKRIVYHFEDLLAHLEIKTQKQLGIKKTKELWYKIGKDATTRYMLLGSNQKKVPQMLQPSIIEYIFSILRSSGMSVATHVDFEPTTSSLNMHGKDQLLARKSSILSYHSGTASAILSFICGQNIEAQGTITNNDCEIHASPLLPKRHISNKHHLKEDSNYFKINFPQNKLSASYSSYNNFIKFKKVILGPDEKLQYQKKTIFPIEAGMTGLITHYYKKIHQQNLLETALVQASEKLASTFFPKKNDQQTNIKIMQNMLSAFGFGIAHLKTTNTTCTLEIQYLPRSKYSNNVEAYMINGYINVIFNKKFKLKTIMHKKVPVVTTIVYEEKNKKTNKKNL